MQTPKKILVCPLNWGLGHATRCVPLIREQLKAGNEVVIVADGYPLKFLRQEFPDLRFIDYSSYPIHYSKKKTQVFILIKFIPKLLWFIRREHLWLQKLIQNEHFDTVISDNRFGMWNKAIHSIYITHQVMIKMPKGLKLLEAVGYWLHKKIIHKYDECWIPDYEANGGLSGDLSHKYALPRNARFVGILSRFSGIKNVHPDNTYENVVILSGVEPQRTLFEQKMIARFRHIKEKTLMIVGKPSEKFLSENIGQITLMTHLEDEKLASCLKGCNKIVSRSGYSTVMDLEALQCLKKAEFHPTPGQTEQEYLADYLLQEGYIH